MKDGKCPKCGATDVRCTVGMPKNTNAYGLNTVPIGGKWLPQYAKLDNYVCVHCGYVENYVAEPDKLQKIIERWPLAGMKVR